MFHICSFESMKKNSVISGLAQGHNILKLVGLVFSAMFRADQNEQINLS